MDSNKLTWFVDNPVVKHVVTEHSFTWWETAKVLSVIAVVLVVVTAFLFFIMWRMGRKNAMKVFGSLAVVSVLGVVGFWHVSNATEENTYSSPSLTSTSYQNKMSGAQDKSAIEDMLFRGYGANNVHFQDNNPSAMPNDSSKNSVKVDSLNAQVTDYKKCVATFDKLEQKQKNDPRSYFTKIKLTCSDPKSDGSQIVVKPLKNPTPANQ